MSELRSYIGESTTDLTLRGYSHIEGLVKLCVDNSLAIDHEEPTVATRVIDDETKAELVVNKPMFPGQVAAKQARITVHSGQSIVDLAIQEMGSIEGLVSILSTNGFSPNITLIDGANVAIDLSSVHKISVRDYFKATSYFVNTGHSIAQSGQPGYVLREASGFILMESSDLIELE